MRSKNWYVITGGPSTGKTTLLDRLKERGHAIIPEAAQIHIDEEISKGLTLEEIRHDEKLFQLAVHKRKLNAEKKHDESVVTFLDRGIHDTAAYLQSYGHTISKEIKETTDAAKYAKVFLLEPFDFFEKSYTRTESLDFTKKINELLADIYEKSGHTVIRVPVLPPAERAEFVLQHVD